MNEQPERVPDITLEVADADTGAGIRSDSYIAAETALSRSAAQALIESGSVFINNRRCIKSRRLSKGDTVEIFLPEVRECDARPENIPLDIIFEDDFVIVINKPQGMVVHPAPGHEAGTLVSALLYHCADSLSDINGVLRPGIVHRIDRDTSGLLVAAKNNEAHLSLAAQLESHGVSRIYSAIVCGRTDSTGTVDAPIGRSKNDRKKMAVVTDGRRAVTHYETAEELTGGYTLLRVRLETGRTHQIRVHMAYIGHPVLGDPVYGIKTLFEKKHPALFAGQCLHAGELCFRHPATGREMTFTCPPPDNFGRILSLLRYSENGD